MDKNTITGFVLIALILIGFSWWQQPSEEQIRQQQQQEQIAKQKEIQSRQAALKAQEIKRLAERAASADTTAMFYSAKTGKERHVVLENKKITVTLSNKGAMVLEVVVKGFKDRNDKADVTLFTPQTQNLEYTLQTTSGFVKSSELFFQPTHVTDSTVTFTAEAKPGRQLVVTYRLGPDYILHSSIQAVGMGGILNPNVKTLDIEWTDKISQQEKGFSFENRFSSLTYHFTEGGTDYLNESKEVTDEVVDQQTDWVAFKNQFFSAVLIAKDNFKAGAKLTSIPQEKGTGYLKQYGAKLSTPFDPTGVKTTEFEYFFGPNDFRLLQSMEHKSSFGKDLELERLVYLGWPLFRYINRWFTLYVFDWLTGLNINMGIVLILITLLLKFITFPLVKKSYMSSAKMRVLKPKLEEATKHLNKPEDQMQKQQAMMAEYAKYGVSPLSGCLPMLIQAPIWIAMFNFVPNAIQLRGESFLWINDLSTYDPIWEWHHNVWLIGDHLSLTCILFCIANVLYSWMTMRQQRDQMVGQQADQMKVMQYMTFIMPFMFFFMFNDYSAGLNFYYFVSLFFSAAIMFVLRKTTNEPKLLAMLEARYKENKDKPKKTSGLAARLQALQEQAIKQQEMARQQRNNRK